MPEAQCPLCQRENQCGLLQKNDKACWCMQEDFTPSVKAALNTLENNKACICKACVNRLRLAEPAQ